MAVNQEDLRLVKSQLWPDEVVEITVRQRRVGPGGSVITPTSVVGTDKRVIIINKTSMGIRKDFEIIPYDEIASVRFEHGVISSSVFIRVRGFDTDRGLLESGRQEGEIDGLNNKDAAVLSDFLNRKISDEASAKTTLSDDRKGGLYVYCSNCGARMSASAKFCSKCGNKL
jgi:hypothetical protein